MALKIYVANNPLYEACIKHVLDIFAQNYKTIFHFVDTPSQAQIVIDESAQSDLPVAIDFYRGIAERKFKHEEYFKKDCLVRTAVGTPDLIATCFYMLNSLQEYAPGTTDEIGRFRYRDSYQFKFNNCSENLVQQYFNELALHPKFSMARKSQELSEIFISHDIDNINSAWMQEGYAAFKAGKPVYLFRLLVNAVIQKPDWFNIDKIMKIHSEYDLKSTFFWLCEKGRINKRMVNADYDVRSAKVQNAIARVKANGFENGVHKSISPLSFQEECKKLGFVPLANRYHYLKFQLPAAYTELEKSKIRMDASLGFAEQYGFRNSYGRPFNPFYLEQKRIYDLIEVPLHVMDRTFLSNLRVKSDEVPKLIIAFFEKNRFDCTLSLLWHNNFFESLKHKGYLEAYRQILEYLHESRFHAVSPAELVAKYSLTATKARYSS